jgi:phage-related baseplate assembly protein
MNLSLLGFTVALQNMVTAAQGYCSQLLNFAVGAVIRAIFEANGGLALWMQWLILQVLAQTRLATSSGADVDSFVGDFGLTRLPGVAATGAVTFSRFTATQPALILPGAQVMTADQTITATVTTVTTNSLWNATSGGYLVPANTFTATVPAQATTVGLTGNISAGTIASITSVTTFDSATNATAFTGGINAESDAALRARFQQYIASLASAIPTAILEAANSVQQGLDLQFLGATPSVGQYTLYVDDGSGDAPDSLIDAVSLAVQVVTAEGMQPNVVRPSIVTANLNIAVTAAAGANASNVQINIQTAVSVYVAGLGIGNEMPFFKLVSMIYGADPTITLITSLTVNSGQSNLTVTAGQLIRLGSYPVSVTVA